MYLTRILEIIFFLIACHIQNKQKIPFHKKKGQTFALIQNVCIMKTIIYIKNKNT